MHSVAPAGNVTPVKGRWGWVDVDVGSSEKISLQDLYTLTPAPARNGTPVKGRWGWVDVDVGSSEKISLQDLYTLARNGKETGLRFGTMGVPSFLARHRRSRPYQQTSPERGGQNRGLARAPVRYLLNGAGGRHRRQDAGGPRQLYLVCGAVFLSAHHHLVEGNR
jgi:hypothetical protein